MTGFRSEYLSMRLYLAELAWMDAVEGIRSYHKVEDRLKQLKKIELLVLEIQGLKERRI